MIAIPPFHQTDTKSFTVILPHTLHSDLEGYRQFYRSAYGADVKEPDLIREIVRCFLDRDESFRAFKSGTQPRERSRSRNPSLFNKTSNTLPGSSAPGT